MRDDAERAKLSDLTREGARLQPERDGRVRWSAWLGDSAPFIENG